MSNQRILLLILFYVSLYILTEASVPLDKRVRTSYTSPESSLKQHYRIGSKKNSSLANHLISLKSNARSSSISIEIKYYSSSTSCSGSSTFSDTFSISSLDENVDFKDLLSSLSSTLPSSLEDLLGNITLSLSGCGSSMNIKICYSGNCHQYPLDQCIDLNTVLSDIGVPTYLFLGISVGSLFLGVTGPPCSSGGVHCLSEDSKVYSSSFQELNIGSIRSNDFILTLDAKSKAIRSTRVIGWLDKKEDVSVTFLGIKHEMGYLKVSPYHLLMRFGANKVDAVFAKDIRIGDNLLFQNNSVASYSQVTEIRNVVQMGAFAPLTMDGNFLANGVLVSCYAHFASHRLAHLAFAPYRWYYSTIGHFTASEPQNHIRLLKTLLHWSNRIHLSSGIIGAKA
ncbi:hypothetical protein GpartN1_g1808.t1 [Galdieria partita]|uniref:Hedgehog protein n=1 Tax=Galdieria partita TaxID=83374 RepID=A0A9C7PUT9_9RHOD|nr:hypothetical protein GpartN1_g1808.t1 [Galdieria partita]